MARLLIIHHTPSPHCQEMLECGSPEIVEGFLSRFGLRLVFPDLIVDG